MHENLKKIIGSEIQKSRKDAGLTQKELAERSGFSGANAIANIENGNKAISVLKLAQICDALDLDPVFFLRKK